MAAGALHSDHINYLIFRYLQEHGHDNAASAFWRDWHRPREYRDPEDLPFARIVQRHELITVVQKGLLYDELSNRVARHGRRFKWTAINPREPPEEQDLDALLEMQNGSAGSRPTSSAKRKGKPVPVMKAADDFPTPAAKRQRRSEGRESVHLNGDAMDVEPAAASPSAAEGEDNGGEAVSPAAGSDVEIVEVPERYDSMDISTQTEVKRGPKTSTAYWKIDKAGATILHSTWNPTAEREDANTLLTVGDGLCRFYNVPHSLEGVNHIEHDDDPNVGANAVITATAWHPNAPVAVYAVDSMRQLSEDKQEPQQQLLCHTRGLGSTVLEPLPPLLEPAGIVLGIRFSPMGDHVLSVHTNLQRGVVQVWRIHRADAANAAHAEPEAKLIAWRIFEDPIFDACWSAEDRFIVSGDKGLSRAYQIEESLKSQQGFTADNVAIQGLIEHRTGVAPSDDKWDKLCLDANAGVAAFASTESKLLLTLPLRPDGIETPLPETDGVGGKTHLPGQLTALAFQPPAAEDTNKDKPSQQNGEQPHRSLLLAAAFEEGFCVIYRVTRTDDVHTTCEEVVKLYLANHAPALGLAWSPDGGYLAVSSPEGVEIWSGRDSAELKNGKLHLPCVTWRPDAAATGKDKRNGEHRDEDADAGMLAPGLSWSADGESLAFTADQQIAVIRFRRPPPDGPNGPELARPETNGAK